MSEYLKHSPEQKTESLDLSGELEKNLKRAEKEAQESAKLQPNQTELAKKAEEEAVSGKELPVGETRQANDTHEFSAYVEIKSQVYKRSLARVQNRLNAPERAMSKVMHHGAVETVSEFAGKTLGRPSAILGGGVAALLGSSLLLYMAKKYGFEYNFFIFFVLLAGGFAVGLLVELLVKLLAKLKR